MSHKEFILKEGAFVIADAHYSLQNSHFYNFLEAIISKKLQPTQLILLGDIFDALFGEIKQTHKQNFKAINLLNELSKSLEIIYFEGNHDFNLKELFPKITILSRQEQPTLFLFESKKVALLHGDYKMGFGYEIFSFLIRNYFILKILEGINFLCFNCVVKKLYRHLDKKDNCKKIAKFYDIIKHRYTNKNGFDFIIEGHFHQNRSFDFNGFVYINLASFACNQRYFIVKSTQDNKLTVEEKLYKEM